ncbi:hypothetical protein HDK77DRAFT_195095 [Phyllosticta capitalensis]|uniref:uncharacterized protein n=1 Tax=Phyllosticta capitalensis TaxID=121624 RepID=UPI00312E847A
MKRAGGRCRLALLCCYLCYLHTGTAKLLIWLRFGWMHHHLLRYIFRKRSFVAIVPVVTSASFASSVLSFALDLLVQSLHHLLLNERVCTSLASTHVFVLCVSSRVIKQAARALSSEARIQRGRKHDRLEERNWLWPKNNPGDIGERDVFRSSKRRSSLHRAHPIYLYSSTTRRNEKVFNDTTFVPSVEKETSAIVSREYRVISQPTDVNAMQAPTTATREIQSSNSSGWSTEELRWEVNSSVARLQALLKTRRGPSIRRNAEEALCRY